MSVEQYTVPEGLVYDTNNLWLKVTGEEALIGLTAYGQSTIGDLIYLELAPEGAAVRRDEAFGSVESGKWVGKLLSPVSGVIIETNREVKTNPRLVNTDPYGSGWMIRVLLIEPEETAYLISDTAYLEVVRDQILQEQEDEGAI